METIGQEAGQRGAAKPGRSALPASGGAGTAPPRDAEEPSAPTPPSSPPARPGMGPLSKLLVYTASVVVVLAVVAATSPLWIDHARKVAPGLGTDPEVEQRIAGLSDRVAELEASREGDIIPDLRTLQAERQRLEDELDRTFKRLETVEEQLSGVRRMVEVLNADMSPAEAEGALRKLSDRLSALEEGAGVGDSSGTIAALKEQVAELEKMMPKAPREAENRASLLALGQLREAVRSGRSYSAELAAFRSVAPSGATIFSDGAGHMEALAHRAAGGLPTQEQFRTTFDKLAGRIVRAAVVEPEGSWMDRTLDRITALVQWRRTDDLEGAGVQAVVARAELRLKAGNLEAAAAEVATLTGPPAEVAGPWLADARAVIAAEKALAALQARAIGRLAGDQ